MNDFELEARIKALRVPRRGEEYWEEFPGRVAAGLRKTPRPLAARVSILSEVFWMGRMAVAVLMLAFCLWETHTPGIISHALKKDERQLRQSVERFHDNLGRLMQDEHGLHRLIEDQP